MIQVKKTRKQKNSLAIIIASAVLAVLVIGLSIFIAVMSMQPEKPNDTNKAPGQYVYPAIDIDRIERFSIDSHKGFFGGVLDDGTYYYTYEDDNGEEQIYYPPICDSELAFNYTSLYATTSDGMNAPKIIYVLSVISSLSYDSIITLSSETDYETQLKTYGLDKESRETVTFSYYETVNGEKVRATRTVHIGNKLVTGTGYYVKLESTDYPDDAEHKTERENADKLVYVSSSAESYSFALEGFTEFVKPLLIMGGNRLVGDTSTTPQHTPSYRQWKSVVFDNENDIVKDKTKVIFTADILSSTYSDGTGSEMEFVIDNKKAFPEADGYITSVSQTSTIDLDYLANDAMYSRIIKSLVGKNVGSYSDGREFLASVIFDWNVAIEDKEYKYTILSIESVIPNDESMPEYTTGVIGDNKLVKVSYKATLDGKAVSFKDKNGDAVQTLHAVIDLTDSRIPAAVRNYLLASPVGEVLGEPKEFSVTYNSETSTPIEFEYRIKEITHVIDKDTSLEVDKISENTLVTFVYQRLRNGEVYEENTGKIELYSDPGSKLGLKIKEALLAKSDKNLNEITNLTVDTSGVYCEIFKNFRTYVITKIDYFVESREIAAFKFAQPSERDVYFGADIHVNDLPEGHKYSSYPIDWVTCDRIIKVLSGATLGSSSTVFEGISGTKVIDVGLTPQNMKEYGLYAYSLYFEIPRLVHDDPDNPGDYKWESSVGFYLYISEKNAEGKRYVGSEMYDLIVEMDAETLSFVEEEFIDFWAKRDVVMVDQEKINKLTAEFKLDGFKGRYDFFVEHPTKWHVIYSDGRRDYLDYDPGEREDIISKQEVSFTNVYAKPYGVTDFNSSLLAACYDKWSKDENGVVNEEYRVALKSVYDVRYFNENPNGDPSNLIVDDEYLGDASFKDVLLILYSTGSSGLISEEDAGKAKEREAVMSFSIEVEGTTTSYVYSFHYTDDGRVAVWINDGHREYCYFYISNFAFKTIENAFVNLVNGRVIFG